MILDKAAAQGAHSRSFAEFANAKQTQVPPRWRLGASAAPEHSKTFKNIQKHLKTFKNIKKNENH